MIPLDDLAIKEIPEPDYMRIREKAFDKDGIVSPVISPGEGTGLITNPIVYKGFDYLLYDFSVMDGAKHVFFDFTKNPCFRIAAEEQGIEEECKICVAQEELNLAVIMQLTHHAEYMGSVPLTFRSYPTEIVNEIIFQRIGNSIISVSLRIPRELGTRHGWPTGLRYCKYDTKQLNAIYIPPESELRTTESHLFTD